jgi:cell division protein YceG involved in septum cleavage
MPEGNQTIKEVLMKRRIARMVTFFLWCLLLAAGALAYEAYRFLTTPFSATPEEVVISIAPGATFDRVAWDLKKAGVITDVFRFRLLAQWQNSLGRIRAGEFLVNKAWTPVQVLKQITEGRAVLYRLTLREGLTWWETARAVEEQGFARYEDFKAVIHDPEFLREHDIPFANAEGFLFPETYLMEKPREPLDREQARIVASRMVRMFWNRVETLWTAPPPAPPAPAPPLATAPGESAPIAVDAAPAAPAATTPEESTPTAMDAAPAAPAAPVAAAPAASSPGESAAPLSGTPVPAAPGASSAPAAPALPDPAASAFPPHPAALRYLAVLASLVEKEAKLPPERGLVAGVYANRLRLGMLLQCDPTIVYGLGEAFSGPIRRSQINDAGNPYNTYQHPGLPPGPICSPGFSSLQAAFSPLRHDYLYFVATGLDGGHTISTTLAEHNQAVRAYRARMQKQKR